MKTELFENSIFMLSCGRRKRIFLKSMSQAQFCTVNLMNKTFLLVIPPNPYRRRVFENAHRVDTIGFSKMDKYIFKNIWLRVDKVYTLQYTFLCHYDLSFFYFLIFQHQPLWVRLSWNKYGVVRTTPLGVCLMLQAVPIRSGLHAQMWVFFCHQLTRSYKK